MKSSSILLVAVFLSHMLGPALADDTASLLDRDAANTTDSPLLPRFADSHILQQAVENQGEHALPDGPSDTAGQSFTSARSLQGRLSRTLYVAPGGRSLNEVFEAILDTIYGAGYGAIYECTGEECGKAFGQLVYAASAWPPGEAGRQKLADALFSGGEARYALFSLGEAGKEVYVAVLAATSAEAAVQGRVGLLIQILDPSPAASPESIIAADQIANALAANGHIALYALQFAAGRAGLLPASNTQIAEIAACLAANPDLKLFVVGHITGGGTLDDEVSLSEFRAMAVVEALAAAGIVRGRLIARGIGPLAPVVANRTTESRKQNTRIELVAQ